MKEKKILLVGKETFMYPFLYLIKSWDKENEVATFWTNQQETELDECDLNSSTYYEFKRRGIKEYTLNEAVCFFNDNMHSDLVDYEYLEKLEKDYSHFKCLNSQLISDQVMSGCYHNRDFHKALSYNQQMLWISGVYMNIEHILDEFNPDVIFDCDIAELPRTVLNEVAFHRNIPYISIEYPRYDLYKIPSYTLNLGIEKYFKEVYDEALLQNNEEEKKYVNEFRDKENIKNELFMENGNPTYSYKAEPLITTLKSIYGRICYFIKQDKAERNKKIKKENPYLYVNSKKYIRFWVEYNFLRRKLYRDKDFWEEPVEGEPYIYMPLHLIPESTTFSMAPFWINELTTIEAVSKSLPAGWRLYVKEHQAMLGERGMDFYSRCKSIPNVRLVRFNYYKDPKPWIENAKAVVTITGTSAYEAALLGKPAFVFGDVPFNVIKGVTRIRDIEELPDMFRNMLEIDNVRECAAYIKAVKTVGEPINLLYIMNTAFAHLTRGEALTKKFWIEIEHLKVFFEKAYERVEEK